MIHCGYDVTIARETVQSYYITLADIDKDRLYAKYARPTSQIQILVALDTVTHSADVPDIYRSIQYGMPRHKSYNILIQQFGRAGRGKGLLGEAIFIVESRWQSPCDKLSDSKHTQPQYIDDFCASVLRNNIHRRQNVKTVDIAGDALSITLVNTKQLVDIRNGRRLSLSGSTVRLPEEFIVPTLRPKKWLTNAQLRNKLLFTLWRLVNED